MVRKRKTFDFGTTVARDFLSRVLQCYPGARLTAHSALQHPYLNPGLQLHGKSCSQIVPFGFRESQLSDASLKVLVASVRSFEAGVVGADRKRWVDRDDGKGRELAFRMHDRVPCRTAQGNDFTLLANSAMQQIWKQIVGGGMGQDLMMMIIYE